MSAQLLDEKKINRWLFNGQFLGVFTNIIMFKIN